MKLAKLWKWSLHGQSVTISVDIYGMRISVNMFRHYEDIEKFQIDSRYLRIHCDISWYQVVSFDR